MGLKRRARSARAWVAGCAIGAATSGAGSSAPSLRLAGSDDARSLDALAACGPDAPYVAVWDREQPTSDRCGQGDARPIDFARMIGDALPLDDATRDHVRAIAAEGARLGRRDDAVGFVGDSVTLEPQFMTPFAARPAVPDRVRDAIAIDATRTAIDLFAPSFARWRAAKTGARAEWALAPDASGESPIDRLVRTQSPAFAVVLFGTNDAQLVVEPLDRAGARVAAGIARVAHALERRGVVPILSTLPKHLRAAGFADCASPGARDGRTNARFMLQTTAASDAIAALAAREHLPLVDLRDALDPLVAHGIAPDGVHPVFYAKHPPALTTPRSADVPSGGGAVLDDRGLACGVNARNLVTLRMLALVRRAVVAR